MMMMMMIHQGSSVVLHKTCRNTTTFVSLSFQRTFYISSSSKVLWKRNSTSQQLIVAKIIPTLFTKLPTITTTTTRTFVVVSSLPQYNNIEYNKNDTQYWNYYNNSIINNNNIMTRNHRLLSSSSSIGIESSLQHKIKAPFVVPSNLTFDPKSHFGKLYDQHQYQQLVVKEEEGNDFDDDDYDYDEEDMISLPKYTENIVYTKPLPERLHIDIHTLFPQSSSSSSSSSMVGTIHLDESVFGCDPIRIDIIKRAVDYYRNKLRGQRNAKTKTIHEVSGSGKKIRNQKGGGVARAGHSRPPHYRGGAKAHGPKNSTNYGNIKLNHKVRQMALRNIFSQKLKEGNLIIMNQLYDLPTYKTNHLAQILQSTTWNIGGTDGTSALLIDHYYTETDNDKNSNISTTTTTTTTTTNASNQASYGGVPMNIHVAAKNIPYVKVTNSYHGMNVYDIVKYDKCIITLAALEQIELRLKV